MCRNYPSSLCHNPKKITTSTSHFVVLFLPKPTSMGLCSCPLNVPTRRNPPHSNAASTRMECHGVILILKLRLRYPSSILVNTKKSKHVCRIQAENHNRTLLD